MRRFGLPAIILLGLVLRVGYALAVYEPSLVIYHQGDYELYRLGGQEILAGDLAFSHNLYQMRPPLFPLLVALLNLDPLWILAVNICLATAIIPLAYALARQFDLQEKPALLCALIVALDPTSVKYSGVLLPEPLANVLLALAYVAIMKLAKARQPTVTIGWGLLSGLMIALSALTRPAAYLLWIPMALWAVIARRGRRGILAACALAAPAALGFGFWTQHNAHYFDNSSYTTVGAWNMVYARAASVLYQASGDDIETIYTELARRVETALGNNAAEVTARWRHRHYTGPSLQQDAMTEVAADVFREHPLHYLLTIPVGMYRMLLQVHGALFTLGLAWNVALLLAAAYGLKETLLRRAWMEVLFLLLPSAYFVTGTLLVCTSCTDTRARIMLSPLLAVMAAYGAMRWLKHRKARSASPSRPAHS